MRTLAKTMVIQKVVYQAQQVPGKAANEPTTSPIKNRKVGMQELRLGIELCGYHA